MVDSMSAEALASVLEEKKRLAESPGRGGGASPSAALPSPIGIGAATSSPVRRRPTTSGTSGVAPSLSSSPLAAPAGRPDARGGSSTASIGGGATTTAELQQQIAQRERQAERLRKELAAVRGEARRAGLADQRSSASTAVFDRGAVDPLERDRYVWTALRAVPARVELLR